MNALAAIRRRASDDEGNARRLRGGDCHVRRCDVRVATGRNVTTRDIDRDQPLPCHEARLNLYRELTDRLTLRLREAAHALRGKRDVALHRGGDVAEPALDFIDRSHDGSRPAIELGRIVAHCLFAVARDLGKHLLNDRARVRGLALRRLRGSFEVLDGHVSRPR